MDVLPQGSAPVSLKEKEARSDMPVLPPGLLSPGPYCIGIAALYHRDDEINAN